MGEAFAAIDSDCVRVEILVYQTRDVECLFFVEALLVGDLLVEET
jgi:hypothetical protein